MTLVNKLHNEFLDEAKKSPILLSDLANLEKYISESYSERSLIELIQNADDANSTKFYIKTIGSNAVLVANNGNYFTEEDVIALCRSGSSTKKRKSNTIGYRGIGFKSIVNYTNDVHLISGDVKLSFSKELTRKELPEIENVPLVRIPHKFNGQHYEEEINQFIDKGYTTIFIFETKFDSVIDEINAFDESCLLFLRNLEEFIAKTNTIKKITSKRDKNEKYDIISLNNNGISKWLILTNNFGSDKVNIAFAIQNNKSVALDKDKGVIHSFMPTKNQFCIPCKVNADFSTDPSRTKIVIDEESINAMYYLAKFFSEIVLNIFNTKEDKFNLMSVISSIYIDPLSKLKSKNINEYFIKELTTQLNNKLSKKSVLIQPDWLNETSFLEVYNNENILITDSLNNKIPGIKPLLLSLGYDEAKFKDTMDKAKEDKFSEDTRVDLVVKSIEKTRFTAFKEDKESINNAYIIDTDDGVKKTKDSPKISDNFVSKVESKLTDKEDLKHFAKKFDLTFDKLEEETKKEEVKENVRIEHMSFKKKNNLTKWRSVEINVSEVIKEWDNIKDVQDVSKMNLGYDTKAIDDDGNELYFEIKSVKSLGDSVSLTNNEYSTAHKYKNQYYLAIASQNQEFIEILFVKNPIETLNLTKRIVQYEWVCNEYDGEYSKTYF